MSRKALYPQSRRHILIYDQDWEWLLQNFGAESAHPYGVGPAIRDIIHKHVGALRQRALSLAEETA